MNYWDDFVVKYDRDGQPISLERLSELLNDPSYRRVAEDNVGDYRVSTVWLGIDYGFNDGGPPVIFETMVFAENGTDDPELDHACWRWCTEEQARAGHQEIVTLVRHELELTGAEGSP